MILAGLHLLRVGITLTAYCITAKRRTEAIDWSNLFPFSNTRTFSQDYTFSMSDTKAMSHTKPKPIFGYDWKYGHNYKNGQKREYSLMTLQSSDGN